MALRIVTADERLSRAANKTTLALFGPSGVGKTSQLKTLPAAETICIDLEAGLKSVQDWRGDSIPIRRFDDAIAIACLIGGVNPAADPNGFFSEAHYQHLATAHPDLVRLIAGKSIVFLDSITDLTRQAMAWAKTRPEAFSDKTGKPDTRGAYGLLAREVIGLLKHLQHAPGKTTIMVVARPRANCRALSIRLSPWACFSARAMPGATTPNAAASADWSAVPAIASACPRRIAPAGSMKPSPPISRPCSTKSTPPPPPPLEPKGSTHA